MRRVLQWLVARPRIYDLVQFMAGTSSLDARTASLISAKLDRQRRAVVIDVGGGTGLGRRIWPKNWLYVCVEPDPGKAVPAHEGDSRVIGDGQCLPFGDHLAQAVMMRLVAHHLDDIQFEWTLGEIVRVLNRDGLFLFIDPVWAQSSLLSRVLWRYDVGRHPRTIEALVSRLQQYFELDAIDSFKTRHRFLISIGHPRRGIRQ